MSKGVYLIVPKGTKFKGSGKLGLSIKVIASSVMPISIDLHVKCPFYKKWNKKKSTIFLQLYPTKYLSQGAIKND